MACCWGKVNYASHSFVVCQCSGMTHVNSCPESPCRASAGYTWCSFGEIAFSLIEFEPSQALSLSLHDSLCDVVFVMRLEVSGPHRAKLRLGTADFCNYCFVLEGIC